MMKKYLIFFFLCINISINAQEYSKLENDSTVLTEYNDGLLWAYQQKDDLVVGMTNYVDKSDYGTHYQILIFIKNLGEESVLFDPSLVTSSLKNNYSDTLEMKVYTYELFMKKVKNRQAWAMALTGLAAGMNAGSAGYQTTYTTSYGAGRIPYTQIHTTYNYAAAAAANTAASTQMMTLSKMMSDDKNTISQGYLKKTTIHPDEGIVGYMNIKYMKGELMTVNIPVEGQVFTFDWDVKIKKKK